MLGWKANKASDLQCDTLDVISSILYNGHAGMFDLNLNQNMKVQYAAAGFENLNDYSEFLLQGAPKEGQKLEDVRALMLEQIEKLKKGEFSDDLIPSVINNMKLSYYTSLQNNKDRADKFVNSFINGIDWKDEVERLDRISKLTKKDIVAFANKFFGNNYACVYKRIGEDKNQKIIDLINAHQKFYRRCIIYVSYDYAADALKKKLDNDTQMKTKIINNVKGPEIFWP
jgi:predicted Zn-dependent peptidase